MPKFKFENGQWFILEGKNYTRIEPRFAATLAGYTSFDPRGFGGIGSFKGPGKTEIPAIILGRDAPGVEQPGEILGTKSITGESPVEPGRFTDPIIFANGVWQQWDPTTERYVVLRPTVQTVLAGYTSVSQEAGQFIFRGAGKDPLSRAAAEARADEKETADAASAATLPTGEAGAVVPIPGLPTHGWAINPVTGEPQLVRLPDPEEDNPPAGERREIEGTNDFLVSNGQGGWLIRSGDEARQASLTEQMAAAFEAGDFDRAREIRDFLNQPQNLQQLIVQALTNPDLTPEQQRAEAQRLFNFANQPTVLETTKLLLEIAQSPADIFALSALMGGAQIDQGFVGGLPRMPELEAAARALLGESWMDFVQAGLNSGGLDQIDDATMEQIQNTETLPEQEAREQQEQFESQTGEVPVAQAPAAT
ncbi:hypothetical protein LCGC14_0735940, partial [marine sediment metagenome]